MAVRQSAPPTRSFAFDVLAVWLLGVACAPFLPWVKAYRGQSFTLLDVYRLTDRPTALPVVAAALLAAVSFLAFAQRTAASLLGFVAGLVAVLFGLDGVFRADMALAGKLGVLDTSIGPWVVLVAGAATLVSSVAAFFAAARRERA